MTAECVFVLTAAVSAIAKFGAHCEELLNSCVVLLERSVGTQPLVFWVFSLEEQVVGKTTKHVWHVG